MAYWFAIRNRKGKLSNYACSGCFAPAPVNKKGVSQISGNCPKCQSPMLSIGLIPEVEFEKV